MTPSSTNPGLLPEIGADRVVADDLKFKARLAIGEQAYTSLRLVNKARELWDVLGAAGTGAAVAQSSVVASTFFAPSGLLGALGLGTAVTPVGWVAVAALASGGACYGLYRLLGNSRSQRIIEIPRYLNTPLDHLGLAIFDQIAPLALRLAAVDGVIEDSELMHLRQHLTQEWGLDERFVDDALACISPEALGADLDEMARQRSDFLHANPDCNHEAIAADMVLFLRSMLESAGPLTEAEALALSRVGELLRQSPPSDLSKAWAAARRQADETGGLVRRHAQTATDWVDRITPSADSLRDTVSRTVEGTRDLAGLAAGKVVKGLPVLKEEAGVAGASVLRIIDKLKNR